jgi:hypothetical protein
MSFFILCNVPLDIILYAEPINNHEILSSVFQSDIFNLKPSLCGLRVCRNAFGARTDTERPLCSVVIILYAFTRI